ncbi:MAG: hypothetical protein GY716_24055 [bacterium]|nr:hypothetical protein [bacterium]
MKRFWKSASDAVGRDGVVAEDQACSNLEPVLERLFEKFEHPEILDVGSHCGSTAVNLAGRGARVSVDQFEPPPLPDAVDEVSPPDPIRIAQEDDRFQLVLGWEWLDFTPPERLEELCAEFGRLLSEKGMLVLFARTGQGDGDNDEEIPGRYRLENGGALVRETEGRDARQRWYHPTRAIEHALAPLSIQGVQLQRNQFRLFTAMKR